MSEIVLNEPYDNLLFEKSYLNEGCKYIAGIDEVGRGPLAGNVVCAAVIMPIDDIIDGITDSKKLSAKKREYYNDIILDKAIAVAIAESTPEIIDEMNILKATKLTMLKALNSLQVRPDIVLVDAMTLDTDISQVSIIKGDLRSYTIACASIVAKVYRDRQISLLSYEYPQYGWDKNKGYGSAQHIAAIREFGATPYHRRSFIKNFINNVEVKGE